MEFTSAGVDALPLNGTSAPVGELMLDLIILTTAVSMMTRPSAWRSDFLLMSL
jgi:hypothetical protein